MDITRKQKIHFAILGILLITTTLVWYVLLQNNNKLVVAFLNVGQGDSIFIQAPNGNQILIDGGADKKVLRELGKVMPFYDRSIDVVVATHPDQDHIGGLPDVLENYSVTTFIDPDVKHNTGTYSTLKEIIEEKGIKKIVAKQNMIVSLGDGAVLEIIFPDRDVSLVESNTASIIARLVYGDSEFMFTGDSPKSIEKYLTSIRGRGLESDVLAVGHHGSKTSSSVEFLAAVAPQFAVISAGENNRYGHPHQEVVDRYESFEIPIFETKNGMVVFESDGKSVMVK